jgi:hypothetical protein
MENDSFIEYHKKSVEFGFWEEFPKITVIYQLERVYKDEVLRNWFISDLVVNGDKFLLKWDKRFFTLSDDEIKSKYRI